MSIYIFTNDSKKTLFKGIISQNYSKEIELLKSKFKENNNKMSIHKRKNKYFYELGKYQIFYCNCNKCYILSNKRQFKIFKMLLKFSFNEKYYNDFVDSIYDKYIKKFKNIQFHDNCIEDDHIKKYVNNHFKNIQELNKYICNSKKKLKEVYKRYNLRFKHYKNNYCYCLEVILSQRPYKEDKICRKMKIIIKEKIGLPCDISFYLNIRSSSYCYTKKIYDVDDKLNKLKHKIKERYYL